MKSCDCAKILIVDDEFLNIYALQILLKNFKLKADTACNGEDVSIIFNYIKQKGATKVIERLKNICDSCRQGYRIVFMDIEMPILNGINAT